MIEFEVASRVIEGAPPFEKIVRGDPHPCVKSLKSSHPVYEYTRPPPWLNDGRSEEPDREVE
jgi:hypothetical protein